MTKPEIEDTGFDPAEVFNEGRELGQSEADEQLREQIAEEMIASGQDPTDVEELLFDPAPRRGRGRGRGRKRGKINCSARQRATMPQICKGGRGYDPAPRRARYVKTSDISGWGYTPRKRVRRVYDPAPVGGYRAAARRYYKKRGGAKGLIAGLKPLILPGATLATVYSKYTERATKLKEMGAQVGTPPHLVNGVWDALMYDLKNRPASSVMDRIKANASGIVVPMLIGGAYKGYLKGKIKLHPKVNQVVDMGAEAAIGAGIGSLINAILDPPNTPAPQTHQQIQVVQPAQMQSQIQAQPAVSSYNSIAVGW